MGRAKPIAAGTELVTLLRARQRRLALTDAEFAALLGTSRPLWVALKHGRLEPSKRVLRGVHAAFPELHAAIVAVLLPKTAGMPSLSRQKTLVG